MALVGSNPQIKRRRYVILSCESHGSSGKLPRWITTFLVLGTVLKARPDKTFYTGSYCARIIKGPTETVRKAESQQTALKKPAVYSPKVETGQRRDLLRAESIIEVLAVLARHNHEPRI